MLGRLIILFLAIAGGLTAKEWVPEFRIVSEKEDRSVKADSFYITFKFIGIPKGTQVQMSHNKTELKVQSENNEYTLRLKAGKYSYMFYAGKKYVEVKSGDYVMKGGRRLVAEVEFWEVDLPRVVEKPVIYLYPESAGKISVKLDCKGKLGFTYPVYDNGWDFTVEKDGKIHKGDKTYNYLFWDAEMNWDRNYKIKEGFVVEAKELINFMEEKLGKMGLNAAEREDLITYWCPRMMQQGKVVLHFKFNEGCNQFANLDISPRPKNIFRVYVLWRRAFAGEEYTEQKIETMKREGFTVVEWGGLELAMPKNICE